MTDFFPAPTLKILLQVSWTVFFYYFLLRKRYIAFCFSLVPRKEIVLLTLFFIIPGLCCTEISFLQCPWRLWRARWADSSTAPSPPFHRQPKKPSHLTKRCIVESSLCSNTILRSVCVFPGIVYIFPSYVLWQYSLSSFYLCDLYKIMV